MVRHRKGITSADLASVFNLSLKKAAIHLGVSPTQLKRICREYNLQQWPYRQIRRLRKRVNALNVMGSDYQSQADATQAEIDRIFKQVQQAGSSSSSTSSPNSSTTAANSDSGSSSSSIVNSTSGSNSSIHGVSSAGLSQFLIDNIQFPPVSNPFNLQPVADDGEEEDDDDDEHSGGEQQQQSPPPQLEQQQQQQQQRSEPKKVGISIRDLLN
jgi:hypothetical protein